MIALPPIPIARLVVKWRHAWPRCRAWQVSLISIPIVAGAVACAGEPLRLTHDGRVKFSPIFTAGGEQVIYVDFERPELFRLKRLYLADGTIEPVHADPPTSEFDPSFSADGQLYAYCKNDGAASVGMVIRDVADGRDAVIPSEGGFFGIRSPAIAPDKSCVLFCYPEKGHQQVFRVNPQGEDKRQLTDGQGVHNWPHFSPDGKWITLSSTRDGNYEIYSLKADGSEAARLTDCPFQDLRPKFSPDGRRIVFTSHRDGNFELYVMNSNGSGVSRLTDHPERDDYADWHPDGRQVVMLAERDGSHDIYLLDVPENP